MNNSSETKNRSLWQDLSISLIALVIIISISTSIIIFCLLFYQSKLQNEQKSEEYLNYLKDTLEIPVWNMDRGSINKICTTFMKNDIVEILIISDYKGSVLFKDGEKETSDIVKKTARITYRDNYIGEIVLGLTSRPYRENIKKLLTAITITMIAVIIGIALGTKLILQQIIQKPFESLIARIQNIREGEYNNKTDNYRGKEIQSILSNFNLMAEEIEKRERDLLKSNLQLSTEIDERIRIEKDSAKQKAEFEAIFYSITDAVIYTDTTKKVVMVNPAFIRLFGYTITEAEGKSIDSILNKPELFNIPDNKDKQHSLHYNQSICEVEYQRKNGSVFQGDSLVTHVFDNTGEIIGFACVIRDISDRKLAEKEKENIEAQLIQAQKMEAIGTLAGGIAHDFNNILSAINGYAELVQEDLPPESSAYEMQEQVLQAGFRAKELVKQILLFSRQAEHETKPVQIHLVLKEALKLLRSTLPTSIEIKKNIAADCGSVIANPTQIHQIILNLCTNASYAMKETGGILTVNLSKTDAPDEAIEMTKGPYVKLEINDTGCGMDEETIEKIFDPYFTTKPVGEGTGMGLSVVLGIIKTYGGLIRVNSEPGKGTSVKMYFPSLEGEEEALKLQKEQRHPKGNENILVVDDETSVLNMTKKSLEKLGYNVVAHSDSSNALNYYKENYTNIDLVVTDMTMPHMNGLELSKQMFISHPDLPVILCTGFAGLITKEDTNNSCIKEILTKPVSRTVFSETIRKILDEGKTA